jgi:putative nucleotidyltransferase with HDIG domain
VSLIAASVSADGEEVKSAIRRLGRSPSGMPGEALEASIARGKGGASRLVLSLPDMESRVNQRAVLGWSGRRSLETVKSVAALVLAAAMHFKALEEYRGRRELFTRLIKMIIGAVDAKDPTAVDHSNRVAELGKELAVKCGLDPEDVDNVYLGGLLHDVGKLGVPDAILNKPGRLDDGEMEVIRRHPSIGSELMSQVKLPDIIMQSIFEHHERPDGAGYPRRLSGSQLSLAGRILKIADVFDALASKRQYKDPMPMEKVYAVIRDGMGTEFDDRLVKILLASPFSGPGVNLEPHQGSGGAGAGGNGEADSSSQGPPAGGREEKPGGKKPWAATTPPVRSKGPRPAWDCPENRPALSRTRLYDFPQNHPKAAENSLFPAKKSPPTPRPGPSRPRQALISGNIAICQNFFLD